MNVTTSPIVHSTSEPNSKIPNYVIGLIIMSVVVIVGGIGIALYYFLSKRRNVYLASYWPNRRHSAGCSRPTIVNITRSTADDNDRAAVCTSRSSTMQSVSIDGAGRRVTFQAAPGHINAAADPHELA